MVGMDAIVAPEPRLRPEPVALARIEAVTPDAEPALARETASREDRPARRERGGRNRGHREDSPTAVVAESAPVERMVETRTAEPRSSEARAEVRPSEVRADRRPDAVRGVRTPTPRDDDDRRVIGFGSDVPAFLARPVPAFSASDD